MSIFPKFSINCYMLIQITQRSQFFRASWFMERLVIETFLPTPFNCHGGDISFLKLCFFVNDEIDFVLGKKIHIFLAFSWHTIKTTRLKNYIITLHLYFYLLFSDIDKNPKAIDKPDVNDTISYANGAIKEIEVIT